MLGRFEGRPGAHRVVGPLVARQQLGGKSLEIAHALVGADRLANREDADRRVTLLDDVPQHVQGRVVGHSRLAYAANGPAHGGLRAVNRFAAAEGGLVARAAPAGAALAAQARALRVPPALAYVGDQAHWPPAGGHHLVDARGAWPGVWPPALRYT